jgi:hypothetical protein
MFYNFMSKILKFYQKNSNKYFQFEKPTDAESYTLFKPLFDPIIKDYHGFAPAAKQPPTDLGEGKTSCLVDLDPQGKYM